MTDPNTAPAAGQDANPYPQAVPGQDPATQPVETIAETEQFSYVAPTAPDLPPNPADTQAFASPAYAQPAASQPYAQPADPQPAYAQPMDQPAYAQPMDQSPYAQPAAGQYQGQYAQYAEPQRTAPYAPVSPGYVPRNKILAGLLAFFFGALGIHNFYLGFTGKAIAQVLLTCLGWIAFGLGPIAAIVWSIVEGVQILTSDYGTPAHRDARGVELVD